MGARLVEMISFEDFHRITRFLMKYGSLNRNAATTDFWTGGLNPGLIWIWSESGQQVDLDRRFWNDNDNSSNAPGCLKLSFSVRLNTLFFKGAPCSQPQNFVCEILNNGVARALASFEKELTD
ncbi:unnamed protein product [Allacma fusca]|uniref:C-type lectin domain-containing protein n=1 Tax=Allacma fusca TaxID=39272 RepID=A0A8J2KIR3_9HEXA|nr:unnamed protein product [Allacma fusca]